MTGCTHAQGVSGGSQRRRDERVHALLRRLLYVTLSFIKRSVKNSFARSVIQGLLSLRHLAILPSWPLNVIIQFGITCVSTISMFFFMIRDAPERSQYSSSLLLSIIVLNDTTMSLCPSMKSH